MANLALARPSAELPARRGRLVEIFLAIERRANARNAVQSNRRAVRRENLGFRYFFLPRKSLLTFRTGRSRARQTPSPSVRMQMRFRSPCQHDGTRELERTFSAFCLGPRGNKIGLPSMRVKSWKKFGNKIGSRGCKWSSLDTAGTLTHQSPSIFELGEYHFLIIGPLG